MTGISDSDEGVLCDVDVPATVRECAMHVRWLCALRA